MNNSEAREILGLDPTDDPRSFIPTFEETLEYKKNLVKNAPSQEVKAHYEQDLLQYETAVKLVAGKRKLRPNMDFLAVLMIIGAFSACGWWMYNSYQQQWNIDTKNQGRITELDSIGRSAITVRKWDEAEKAYQEILEIDPESKIITERIEEIRLGKLEEINQQIFYLLGESQVAIEDGQWVRAEELITSVIKIAPENTSAQEQLVIISKGKRKQQILTQTRSVTEALAGGKIREARAALKELKGLDPENAKLPEFEGLIEEGEARILAQQEEARTLLKSAQALDNGEFSATAIALLTEAQKLDPKSTEISELFQKMSQYTRALHVPADFATIALALDSARPHDLIRISKGVYKEALVIDKPIRIQGAIDGGTILQLDATEGSLITVLPEAKKTLINNLTLKHLGFDHQPERCSGIIIMASEVKVIACHVSHSPGHGITVTEGGDAQIISCETKLCGWNGISVYGEKSHATVRDSNSHRNIQHGLGIWGGGSSTVTKSRMTQNGLCGILAMSRNAAISISSSNCSNNREAGILASDGVKAEIKANRCDANLLSGIIIRGDTTTADVTNNVTQGNYEIGILTQRGVKIGQFENNQSSDNKTQQIWRDANLELLTE